MISGAPRTDVEEAHRSNVACALEVLAKVVQQRRRSPIARRSNTEAVRCAQSDDLSLSAHAFCFDEDEPCPDGDDGAAEAEAEAAAASPPASDDARSAAGRKGSDCESRDEGNADWGSLLSQASTVHSSGARDEAEDPDFLPCLDAGEHPPFASFSQLFLPSDVRSRGGRSSAGSTPFGSPRMPTLSVPAR